MARSRIVVDISTGQQTAIPYTPEEEAEADAAYAAERLARSVATAAQNGAALAARRRETAKEEAAALASAGDYTAAITKLMELI